MPFEYSSNGFFIRKLKTPAHLKRCAGQNRVAYRCSTDSKQANKYTSEELFGRSLVVGDGVTAADERPVLRAVTILASNGFLPSSIGNGIEQRQRIGIGSRTQVEVHGCILSTVFINSNLSAICRNSEYPRIMSRVCSYPTDRCILFCFRANSCFLDP